MQNKHVLSATRLSRLAAMLLAATEQTAAAAFLTQSVYPLLTEVMGMGLTCSRQLPWRQRCMACGAYAGVCMPQAPVAGVLQQA